MQRSESISKFAPAFCKAQGEFGNAIKDKLNPAFKSKYADLGAVWEAALPALQAHALSVIQLPVSDEPGYAALETILLHESGEFMASTTRARIVKDDPQGYGSAITFLRRYSLAAALGITQEDDDGNAASHAQPRQQPRTLAAQTRPAAQATEHLGKASGEVIAINKVLSGAYGFKSTDRDRAISFVGYLAKIPGLASTKDLTDGEARGVLSMLNARKDDSERSELLSQWADHMAQA